MSVYNERLQDLGERAANVISSGEVDTVDESTRDLAYLAVLAAYFDYQVKNGGFGQLIYNLRGERLEHYDGMLRAVGAPVALSYYVRAITCCVNDLESYNAFLADFTVRNALADDLTLLGIEYLRGDTCFDDEIAEFLDLAEVRI